MSSISIALCLTAWPKYQQKLLFLKDDNRMQEGIPCIKSLEVYCSCSDDLLTNFYSLTKSLNNCNTSAITYEIIKGNVSSADVYSEKFHK